VCSSDLYVGVGLFKDLERLLQNEGCDFSSQVLLPFFGFCMISKSVQTNDDLDFPIKDYKEIRPLLF
jgi:hypothetical protein